MSTKLNWMDEMMAKYPLVWANGGYQGSPGPGWNDLLERAFSALQAHLSANPEVAKSFFISDMKEKFGTLRFYYHGGDDTVEKISNEAEWWSCRTCESCGKAGATCSSGYWISTRCPACKLATDNWVEELTNWVSIDTPRCTECDQVLR